MSKISPCDQNYYGQKCQIFCKPYDTPYDGHYYCEPKTGRKVCLDGWKNEEPGTYGLGGNDCKVGK